MTERQRQILLHGLDMAMKDREQAIRGIQSRQRERRAGQIYLVIWTVTCVLTGWGLHVLLTFFTR